MAESIIAGIVKDELVLPEQIWVTNRSNANVLAHLHNKYGVNAVNDTASVVNDASIIIMAVKPKDIQTGIQTIAHDITENQLFISVLAGVPIAYMAEQLPIDMPIIRAMPNTSATVGQSATALAKKATVSNQHMLTAETLFTAIGSVAIVEEDELHAVTGISGSGPAYLYYLAEAFEEKALQLGLNQTVAKELIAQTFIGAADMLTQSGETAETLRHQVTSPGGTTEAGIHALQKHHFKEAAYACIDSAIEKSRELESLFK